MGAKVFANGREVSAKKDDNKHVAGMPDVCLSPPSPPAGPIPIPYPNFAQASKTSDGTKKVKIKGQEAGKKNKSNYSKSQGDTAATRSFGMGVVTHKLEGKEKYAAWSSDVKFEKNNVIRQLDITTGNHGSGPNSADMSPGAVAGVAPSSEEEPDCEKLRQETDRMRRQTEAESSRVEGPELREASDATQRARTPEGRRRARQWQARVEARIRTRAQGALTACQAQGGPIRRYASNGLNREALQQRGVAVENQPPVTDTDSNVCGQNEPYDDEAHKYHTESQFLEAIDWNNPPSSITFATDWPARTNGQIDPERADGPCEHCQDKLNEACECGLKIYICDGNDRRNYCEESGAGM